MSTLELVAMVIVAGWLAVLTVVALLLVRQIGLLTVRLDRDAQATAPVGDGLAVGQEIPEMMRPWLDEHTGPQFILVLGAVCAPCREIADELQDASLKSPVLALISGRRAPAQALRDMLPSTVRTVLDPDAEAAVRGLAISTTPFVFEVRGRRIAAKAALRGTDHLERFISEAEAVPTEELQPILEVKAHASG